MPLHADTNQRIRVLSLFAGKFHFQENPNLIRNRQIDSHLLIRASGGRSLQGRRRVVSVLETLRRKIGGEITNDDQQGA